MRPTKTQFAGLVVVLTVVASAYRIRKRLTRGGVESDYEPYHENPD